MVLGEQHIKILLELAESYDLLNMYVFGSYVCGEASPGSDLDILITYKDIPPLEYSRQYFALKRAIEDKLRLRVDLVTEPYLRNPYLIKSIRESLKLIYAA